MKKGPANGLTNSAVAAKPATADSAAMAYAMTRRPAIEHAPPHLLAAEAEHTRSGAPDSTLTRQIRETHGEAPHAHRLNGSPDQTKQPCVGSRRPPGSK